MTLDEAIEDFRYDAEQNMADLDVSFAKRNNQIADWLEDYKRLCTEKEQDIYERAYREGYDKGYSDGRFAGYNKAIDDFVNAINQISYVPVCVDCLSKQQIRDIAKQLKNIHDK